MDGFAAPMDGFAAPMDTFAAPMDAFAAPPADDPFVGTIDETPSDAPIVLGGPMVETELVEDVTDELGVQEPLGPTPIQKWNEEWGNILMGRKDSENATKAEYIAKAEETMKNFHDQRDTKRESKLTTNRADEQEKLEAIEADLENDNSWQRVCKMVELTHDSAENAVDVKRMRDVMILLKNEPTRATLLA